MEAQMQGHQQTPTNSPAAAEAQVGPDRTLDEDDSRTGLTIAGSISRAWKDVSQRSQATYMTLQANGCLTSS
jgi:hypothetical protein